MIHVTSLGSSGCVRQRAAAGRTGHAAQNKAGISITKWSGLGQGEEKYSQFAAA